MNVIIINKSKTTKDTVKPGSMWRNGDTRARHAREVARSIPVQPEIIITRK